MTQVSLYSPTGLIEFDSDEGRRFRLPYQGPRTSYFIMCEDLIWRPMNGTALPRAAHPVLHNMLYAAGYISHRDVMNPVFCLPDWSGITYEPLLDGEYIDDRPSRFLDLGRGIYGDRLSMQPSDLATPNASQTRIISAMVWATAIMVLGLIAYDVLRKLSII